MKRAAVAALCVAACAHARLPTSAVDGASSYVAPRAFVASPAADGWTRELRVAAGAPGASWVVDAALMEAAQAVAERIFQPLDLKAERGLPAQQRLGGAGEAAGFGDGDERP